MKITTTKLKQLIREAIEGMVSEQYPKVRELIGPDLLAKALAMMKDLENRMNTDHGMMGGGAPYPKDSKLFLKALEAVLGDANSGGLREGHQGSKDDVKIVKDKKTGKYKIKDGGKFARGGKSYDTRKAARDSDEYAELTTPGGDW